jgi:hypothetical protein
MMYAGCVEGLVINENITKTLVATSLETQCSRQADLLIYLCQDAQK